MDVAAILRGCRREAGLTQRELARRAGTSQPALARYERGHSTPSVATLERLLAATGHGLRVDTATSPGTTVHGLVGRREELLAILRHHEVERASVFGSVARGEDREGSDLDLLVEMPSATLVRLASLRADLEEALDRPVDVTTADLLLPEVRERAILEAVPL